MLRSRIIDAALAVCVLLGTKSPATADTYQNPQYGFEVQIPEGFATCSGARDAPAPNHGVDIFLDRSDRRECEDVGERRAIMFFASYNVIDETRTLRALLKWDCEVRKGICKLAPDGLRLGMLRTASGRIDHPDGSIDVIVVAQGGKWSRHYADDPEFSVNYEATLHTSRDFLAPDLALFRKALKYSRFTPPNG